MVALALAVLLSLVCFGTPETSPSDLTASEKQQIVDKHNALRRGVEPTARNMLKMSWSNEAAVTAQKHANKCTTKHSDARDREISQASVCGENLAFYSYKEDWPKVIQGWYDEVKYYKYGVGVTEPGVTAGHYTQIAWYKSYLVGCAIAECPQALYKYLYICHYCPAGNYKDTNPYSAGPSCADCPKDCDDKLCTNPCPYMDLYNNCPDMKEECKLDYVHKMCRATCSCTSEIK